MTSAWIMQIFNAQQARCDGIVRRNIKDVERNGGREVLVDEARRRGFHVAETGDQMIILCNEGTVTMHC